MLLPVIITFLAIVVICLLIKQYVKYRKQKALADGPVQRVWDRFSTAIFSVSIVTIVAYYGIPVDQFEEAFGMLGELVKAIDAVIALIGLIWTLIRGWF